MSSVYFLKKIVYSNFNKLRLKIFLNSLCKNNFSFKQFTNYSFSIN